MFLSEVGIRYEIRKGDIAWNLWKNGHKLRNIDRGNKFIPLAPTLPQIAHTLSKTFLPYLVGEIGSLFSAVIACTRVPNGYDFEVIYTYDNERLLVTIERNSFARIPIPRKNSLSKIILHATIFILVIAEMLAVGSSDFSPNFRYKSQRYDENQGARKYLWKKKIRIVYSENRFPEQIDISSLTGFREKEKITYPNYSNFFFNFLSNIVLRILEYRPFNIDRGRYARNPVFEFDHESREKYAQGETRVLPFPLHDFPLSIDDTPPRSGYRRGMRLTDAASEIEKSKRRSLPSLSLELRVIIISIGAHPTFSYQTQRANVVVYIIALSISALTLQIFQRMTR